MIESILSQFEIPGAFVKAEKWGTGLINDTWLCEYFEGETARRYILQRLNPGVFARPAQVMENIRTVTDHMVRRLAAAGIVDPRQQVLSLVYAADGKPFVLDAAGGAWRVSHYIESCSVYDVVSSPDLAREIGRGLGRFQALVSDLQPHLLHDTLPSFHNTPYYLREFDDALKKNAQNRADEVRPEVEFVNRRRRTASLLMDRLDSGRIPMRVVHNDPKANNVLISDVTGRAVCMIDLDTVKPGIVHFDFGDCVRSACNPAGEDAKHFGDIRVDLDLFAALAEGYLGEAAVFLTPDEIELLAVSPKVITYELGLRFLADYLRGDTYFKTTSPAQNLHRARVQFLLLEDMERAEPQMAAIVKKNRA